MAWQFTKEVFVGVRSRVLEAILGLLTKLCEIESKISKKEVSSASGTSQIGTDSR